MTFTPGDPKAKAGRARMLEIGAEHAEAVRLSSLGLLSTLGREPTPLETFQAESICSLFLKANRARFQGRDDTELLAAAQRMVKGSVFAPQATPAREPTRPA